MFGIERVPSCVAERGRPASSERVQNDKFLTEGQLLFELMVAATASDRLYRITTRPI